MRRLMMLATLALIVAACRGPYRNVSPQAKEAACGSEERYEAALAAALESEVTRPYVGMPVCDLVAGWGQPHETTVVDVGGGPSLHWTYWFMIGTSRQERAHLVTLEPGPDGSMVVSSVVWH